MRRVNDEARSLSPAATRCLAIVAELRELTEEELPGGGHAHKAITPEILSTANKLREEFMGDGIRNKGLFQTVRENDPEGFEALRNAMTPCPSIALFFVEGTLEGAH